MAENPSLLLLYDGVCGLCNGFVRHLLRADRHGKIRFAPLQGPTAGAILSRHKLDGEILRSVIVVENHGVPEERVAVRSEAVRRAYRALGGPWRGAAGLIGLAPQRLRDAAYDWVARRRYRWFGKYDACPVPPPEGRERFLP